MHFKALFICLFSLSALVFYTSAHSVILQAQGDGGRPKSSQPSGRIGMALGVDPSTPRNGAAVDPHQRDGSIFTQRSIKSWKGCGQTIQSGPIIPAKLTPQLVQRGQIAQVSAGGWLFMILHQITGDGNGPYTCGIDTTGAGTSYSQLTITRQVPGQSPYLNSVWATSFPLQAAMPADLKCTGSFGGMNNICLIRCQNSAVNGPFGGCVPVQVVPVVA